MYTISKSFDFSASHIIDGVASNHPCARLHGHNWVVTLHLASPDLDECGFVVDFVDLARFKRHIDERFDHRHLNDVLTCSPTSENLARHFYDVAKDWWPSVAACVVSEPPKTSAVYAPGAAVILSR